MSPLVPAPSPLARAFAARRFPKQFPQLHKKRRVVTKATSYQAPIFFPIRSVARRCPLSKPPWTPYRAHAEPGGGQSWRGPPTRPAHACLCTATGRHPFSAAKAGFPGRWRPRIPFDALPGPPFSAAKAGFPGDRRNPDTSRGCPSEPPIQRRQGGLPGALAAPHPIRRPTGAPVQRRQGGLPGGPPQPGHISWTPQ